MRKSSTTNARDKVLLVESQGSDKVLNKEELEFLADPRVAEGPVTQTVITYNAPYQADDLDSYDSDCEDFSTAKAILMANLSSYGSDVLFEDTYSSAKQDAMILSMFEQLLNQVTNCNKVNKDNLIANESLSAELERYKERKHLMFSKKSKEKEAKNIDKEIALGKKVKELDNIICKIDFAKRFVVQQELSDEQAFRLQTSHPNTDQSAYLPVTASRELPKITLDALTEWEWGLNTLKLFF
nr:hypothetical protein [Tanacetum cinerariifolium]